MNRVQSAQTTFDLLFVNAGVTNGPEETVADVTTETYIQLDQLMRSFGVVSVIEAPWRTSA